MLTNSIKFALPEDVAQIVSLGYKSFDENQLGEVSNCSPDFDKTLIAITDMLVNDVVLVKRNDENPKLIDGVIILKINYLWWSSDPCLVGVLFYTKPEHRSFTLAKNLLNAAKEYAIINNLPIVFDIFARKDVQKKIKLLKYLGFKECGTLYVFKP